MQNEKIAVIALVIIIVGALSVFLAVTYGEDILNNLFREEKTIELGDCADVNYIGKLVDGTVFDSSYTYPDNKTGGTPLNVFVTMDQNETSPKTGYSSSLIEGFMEGLVGLKEGETKTIGPIPPEKGYGANKLGVGDTFTTGNLAVGLSQTVQVTSYTDEAISFKWTDPETLTNFTMPQYILKDLNSQDPDEQVIIPPPYYIWTDSSEVVSITDEEVIVTTTPGEAVEVEPIQYGTLQSFIFPDATTIEYNDTTITITTNPVVGANYSYTFFYGQEVELLFTVENVTDDLMNISVLYIDTGESSYQLYNKTIEFNRTFTMPRAYNNIPLIYQIIFEEDAVNAGYTLHELAGKELFFEVTIEEIYKTSQEES